MDKLITAFRYHDSTALGEFDIEDQTEKRSATQTPKMTSQQLRRDDRNLGVAPNRSLWSDFRHPKLPIAPFHSHQLQIRPRKKKWNPSTKTPSYVISTTSLLEALALAAILTWQGWRVDEKTTNICMDFSSYKVANKTCFLVFSFTCYVLIWSIHYLFTFVSICS